MERILNMILRRLINKGMNSGIKAVSNRGKDKDSDTPQQSSMGKQGKNQARTLRQAARTLRKMNKL